jgi:peptidoglycan/LPS O-acetylase OafA/YrhL
MQIYFPGLNGIRAIAASVVIFFHINSTMWFFGTTPIHYFEARDEMSRHAVVLFFVLSGYLITYLLMREKKSFGTVSVGKFYFRRILRIWPLFYLALLISLLIIPFDTFGHSVPYNLKSIFLYALFVPNFALMAGYMLPTIAPLWSIGIEEQFYAVWPVVIKYAKNIFLFLATFLALYISVKLILLLTGNVWSPFSVNFNYFSYDSLAIGGIAAWIYLKNHRILTLLYHPVSQIICWLFFAVSCIFGPIDFHYIINKEVYSIAFAIIILNVGTNPRTIIKLRGRLLDFLGRISYGMYVLHPFIIILAAIPLKYIIPSVHNKPLQFIIISTFVFPLSVLIAWLSFQYFESGFLKKKKRYMKISSTNTQLETKDQSRMVTDTFSL